ncbi:MAG: SLC13/DASS family transporter [Ruminococcaceae bacterium]|nr:SLC13/DASS family transporter [Oscillospiraceae bacterium]
MGIDVISLVIFIGCIVLFIWDKLPMATTAIIGCALMVICGVCDFKTAFGSFSSSTVILTIGVMIIGSAIAETGLAETIGRWIIRVSKGSETKLIAGTYLVSALMSAFLTNSAVLAIFIPIIMGLSKSNEKIKSKNLIMPIAYGCVIGGASTLVGSTQQMTAQGLLEENGIRLFKTFDFTLVAGIILILGLFYCLFIGRKLGEKIWGNRPDDDSADVDIKPSEESYSKTKMIIMACIFSVTVVLYITEWLPLAITSTSAALLCIVTGCITQKKAVLSVNWNIVGRLAGCLGLAQALSSAGGTELITKGFNALVGDSISPFLLFCILVFLVQFTSEFISNSTAILIVLPIVIAIAPDMGLNTYAFALGITVASGVALSCPLASSTLGMSMSVGYRFNDYFKYSIIFDVVSYLVVVTLVPMIYGLTV